MEESIFNKVLSFLFYARGTIMDKYIYDGPVMEFDTCIANHWKGETMAPSRSKAISNLKYRFKKENNRLASAKIDLPGKIILVKRKDEYRNGRI